MNTEKHKIETLSLVIPCLNEEEVIVETIRKARSIFDSMDLKNYEIIIVDDGSTDQSAKRALSEGAQVIQHPHNAGYGKSIKDGISQAKHDTIIISDADGTYPLEEIPMLTQEYEKGFDMVVGARTGPHYRESWSKEFLRYILKWLVEFTAGRPIPDINSGLRIFSRKVSIQFFNRLCNTFSFTTGITLAYMMTMKYVVYVPIPYRNRVGKSKVRIFRDSMRTLQFIVEAILFYNPIKIFIVLCLVSLLFSLASFLIAYSLNLEYGFFLGMAGILTTFVIFSLGLLSILLSKNIHLKK
jgi:glycosyltransferase involved in cell wall biosynthesis